MISIFQIDKSGGDIFDKYYSIILIVNKKEAYGINIPPKIKEELSELFRRGEFRIEADSDKKKKNRFRLRFHTAIVIILIEKAIKDLGNVEDMNIQICNDFDGHFHEIKDMVFKHLSKISPNLEPQDIVSTKFQKPSFIDEVGKAFRNKDKNKLKNYHSINLNIEELIKLIKK